MSSLATEEVTIPLAVALPAPTNSPAPHPAPSKRRPPSLHTPPAPSVGDSSPWWPSQALRGSLEVGGPGGGSPAPRGVDGPSDSQLGPWPGAAPLAGLFGTGIQSYFTFLRFLLLLNLLTLLLTASFVLLPLVWLRPRDPGPALNFSECPGPRE